MSKKSIFVKIKEFFSKIFSKFKKGKKDEPQIETKTLSAPPRFDEEQENIPQPVVSIPVLPIEEIPEVNKAAEEVAPISQTPADEEPQVPEATQEVEKNQSSKEPEQPLIWKVPEVAKLYVADDAAIILKRNMKNKLKFAKADLKDYYNSVKNYLMSYRGVKARMSNVSENFRLKRTLLAKITLAGANLKLYLALNPSDYPQNIYHQKDMGNMNLYAAVPFMVKLKTKLSVRKACILIDEVMKKFGLKKIADFKETDYKAGLKPAPREVLAKSRSVVMVRKSQVSKKNPN